MQKSRVLNDCLVIKNGESVCCYEVQGGEHLDKEKNIHEIPVWKRRRSPVFTSHSRLHPLTDKRFSRNLRIAITVLSCSAALILIFVSSFLAVRQYGKERLYAAADTVKPDFDQTIELWKSNPILSCLLPEQLAEDMLLVDGDKEIEADSCRASSIKNGSETTYDIIYNEKKYKYNTDILNLLILGIDKMEPVSPAPDAISGGQADALFLLVMNPHTKTIDMISIPRDTITRIWIYNKDGSFDMTARAQICLQHGYGDGMSVSNENTKKAVSHLFYELPIHSVSSMNMGAIGALNDAVGGVTLEPLSSFSTDASVFVQGETITLQGIQAYDYLHYRDINRHYTAEERLERQKQYITLFISQSMEAARQNIQVVPDVYQVINDYTVTDLSINEMTYLASEAVNYQFGQIYTLEGTVDTSRTYERYYLNEEAFDQLIVDLFYEEIK